MAIVAVRRPRVRGIGHARAVLRDLRLARRLQSPWSWHDAEFNFGRRRRSNLPLSQETS